MSQLCFPFAQDAPAAGPSWSTRYWRGRIDRAVSRAFELGRRQRQPPPRAHAVDAAVAPMPARFEPVLDEANELLAIAARLARLTVSRKDPHAFFEEKSSLVFELRQIARRSGVVEGCVLQDFDHLQGDLVPPLGKIQDLVSSAA